MKLRAYLPLVALFAGCGLAGGCANMFKVPYPAKDFFLVDPGQPDERGVGVSGVSGDSGDSGGAADPVVARPAGAVLKVRQLRVAAPFDGSAFVYKVGPNRYVSDYYDAFLMPTDKMLSAALCDWLRKSGLFANVVESGSRVHARYTLEGGVNGIYADFTQPKAPTAVVRAEFMLSSDEDAGPRVLFAKSYFTSAPVTGAGPAGIAEAWNQACRKMLTELTSDLARAEPVIARNWEPGKAPTSPAVPRKD